MSYSQLRKGRWSQSGQIYHVITRTHACHPLFQHFETSHRFCMTLRQLEAERCVLPLCWVLMPDHLHLLIELRDEESLGDCVKHIKGRSSKELNRLTNRNGTVWQKAYYDRALRREDDLLGVARYIVANPLRAGLVQRIGDYPFWDAVWL